MKPERLYLKNSFSKYESIPFCNIKGGFSRLRLGVRWKNIDFYY